MNLRHVVAVYRGEHVPHIDVIGRRNRWFAFSGALVALSIAGLAVRGLNFSIDFEGGAELSFRFVSPVTADQVQGVLTKNGIESAEVQIVNGDTVSVRTESLGGAGGSEALRADLAKLGGVGEEDISVDDIGPTWGGEISNKAERGLVIVLLAIAAYIGLRFAWEMAAGAFIALVHDVTITAGIYALTGREVTPETVIAILTILGFSLYDTVVIYDKVQENTESTVMVSRHGYAGVVNLSVNQVLMRSVNTSLVVLLPILSLLLIGGSTLKDFAFAMFIGTAVGAYSSIFVAAPLLTVIKERQRNVRAIDARRGARGEPAAGRQTDEVRTGATAATSDVAARGATARTGAGGRPRPKSRRRPPAKRKRR
jgi:preprotein translocase subunit SecF